LTPVPSKRLFPGIDEYRAIPLSDMSVVWLARVGRRRTQLGTGALDTLRAVLYSDGEIVSLGPVALRNDAFLGHGVAVSSTEVLLFTTQAPRPDDPIIKTIVSRLVFACS
jgi:hypothetical protein